jgi:hypothetical protein
MPNGLYRKLAMQESETANRTDPLQKIESSGKPDFSVVYATRIEFLRTTRLPLRL